MKELAQGYFFVSKRLHLILKAYNFQLSTLPLDLMTSVKFTLIKFFMLTTPA